MGDVFNYTMEDMIPEELGRPWEDSPPPVHVIGNLPFSISTPLLIRWLRMASRREGPFVRGRVPLTLTFQKEVAERMVAPVMNIQRCRLSVMCQTYCHIQHRLTLSGGSFFPRPDVDVGVVRLVPLTEPLIKQPFDLVEKVCNCLFNSRQKFIRNTLKNLFPVARPELSENVLKLIEVDPETRVVQLTVEEVGRICEVYEHFCFQEPELRQYNFRLGKW